jgi:hypothetical protein
MTDLFDDRVLSCDGSNVLHHLRVTVKSLRMKLSFWLVAMLILAISIPACKKANKAELNCELFTQGVLDYDNGKVKQALGPLLSYHTYDEFQKLINALSGFCNVKVENPCFGCLYSLPPQSPMTIYITVNTSIYKRGLVIGEDSHSRMTVRVE